MFRKMAAAEPDYVSSDCAIAGRHIKQGIADSGFANGNAEKSHPLTLIRLAYGL